MALGPDDKKEKRQAAQDDAFLREVDDALRQDQMATFFQRFGIPVIIAVVAILVGLAAYLWWKGNKAENEELRGEEFVVALDTVDAGNLDAADKQLAEIASQDAGASAVAARLMRAGIALEQGRSEEAVKAYAAVAADEDAPQPYRDLATVREVAASFDSLDPQQVIDRLKPLAAPGNPWFGVAGELVGVAYLKQGKEDLAGPLFAQIARDETAPESLRSRTRQLAGLLGVDAIDEEDDSTETEPAPAPAQ